MGGRNFCFPPNSADLKPTIQQVSVVGAALNTPLYVGQIKTSAPALKGNAPVIDAATI